MSFIHVGYVTSIAPGATIHWHWNNAPKEVVWTFSADAMVPLGVPPVPGATARIQVSPVEYREIYHGGSSFEKEVHYWIKNTGTIKADFALHMVQVWE
jgi:hypothetical protein